MKKTFARFDIPIAFLAHLFRKGGVVGSRIVSERHCGFLGFHATLRLVLIHVKMSGTRHRCPITTQSTQKFAASAISIIMRV